MHNENKKTFWGYIAIGFIAMIGGVVMFAITVPKWDKEEGAAPYDLVVVFSKVYSVQANLRSAGLPYSPSLENTGIEKETCEKFSCTLKLIDAGKDFEMRMTKGGRTWQLTSKSMIPEEIKIAEVR